MLTHPILSKSAKSGVRLGLESLKTFLIDHSIDVHSLPFVIHISGTNGKGSVCRMLENIYLQAGYSVGLYTSPHLQDVNERVRINGKNISDGKLEYWLEHTENLVSKWSKQNGFNEPTSLTYFEMMTSIAFQEFIQQKLDVVILEVGLGGRLDATNIVTPSITGIISIGLDHQDVLGNDISSIATEKAGIVKQGVHLVVGSVTQEALTAIRLIAEEKNSQIHLWSTDYHALSNENGLTWTSDDIHLQNIEIGLPGNHQIHNAGVALKLVQLMQQQRPVSTANLRLGLKTVTHPGRMEWIGKNVLLDSAHNPAGARQLAEYLLNLKGSDDRKITLVFGCSVDKDIRNIALQLSPVVQRIFATHCSHPRACQSDDLVRIVKTDAPIFDMGSIENVVTHCREDDLVVVAGSIFLVGAARQLWMQ